MATNHQLMVQAQKAFKRGLFEEASAHAHRVIRTESAHGAAWHLLGLVALEEKKYLDALGLLMKACASKKAKAIYYFNLGFTYRKLERNQEALEAYSQCVALDPNMAKAWGHLGHVNRGLKFKAQALECYQKALTLEPENGFIYYSIALLYHLDDQTEEAIPFYKKAIQYDKSNAKAYCYLGVIYSKLKNFEKAVPYYKKAIKVDPNHFEACNFLGGTLIELERFEEAEPYLRKAIQMEPSSCQTFRNLTTCKKYLDANDPDIKSLLALLEKPYLSDEDKNHLHFALGKIYYDLNDVEKAFFYYKKANDDYFKSHTFNPAMLQDYIQSIKDAFSETFTLLNKNLAHTSVNPLIVVGLPRSGKTLLEKCLQQHSQISNAGEVGLSDFASHGDEDKELGYPLWLKSLNKEQAQNIASSYEKRLLRDVSSNKYVTDTMPGNAFYLGLYALLFPTSKILYVKRDPHDSCLMMYFRYFVDKHYYSYDLKTLGQYYVLYYSMMEHWKMLLGNQIFEVEYEQLVQNPEKVMQDVYSFLKLDFKRPLLKVHTDEVGIHLKYQAYLEDLNQSLKLTPQSQHAMRMNAVLSDATVKHKAKQYEEASTLYRYVMQKDPTNAIPVHLLGVIAHELGQDDKAIAFILKAIEMNPNYFQAHSNLSIILQKNGRHIEAEHHFKIAQSLSESANNQQKTELSEIERDILRSVFIRPFKCVQEFEHKMLFEGEPILKSAAFVESKIPRYFSELSFGVYRSDLNEVERHKKSQSWDFLFKNIAVVNKILSDQQQEFRILDIGCKSGHFRRFIEGNLYPTDEKKIYYWGVDFRKSLLEQAVTGTMVLESGASGNQSPTAYLLHDIQMGLPFKDESFDWLVNFDFFSALSLKDGVQLVLEMKRVLKQKGYLILGLQGKGQERTQIGAMKASEMKALLEGYGFSVELEHGVTLDRAKIVRFIKSEHKELVEALLKVHPPEIVFSWIAPLYPELCVDRYYCLRKHNT